jgi:hypothetical protein
MVVHPVPDVLERERPRRASAHEKEQVAQRALRAERVLQLQRSVGNRAVARWLQRSPTTWAGEPTVQSIGGYLGLDAWRSLCALVEQYGALQSHELRERERTLTALTKAIAAWRADQATNWWHSWRDKAKYALVNRLVGLIQAEQDDIDRTEEARAEGSAAKVLKRARANAEARADEDYNAALARLETQLHIPKSQVEFVLVNSLLVLAKAPLTRNFDHRELKAMLEKGGFRGYWHKMQVVADPGPNASPEDRRAYDYQQERLEGDSRLFGGSMDPHFRRERADEQALATTANIAEYKLGGAPNDKYGRSAAKLREGIKRRATYTPSDALDVLKKTVTGQGFIGPEIVATHDNLAAIIRYTDISTLRDIVNKAKDPNLEFKMAVGGYIEAQIHGPILLTDIERITFALDDLENEAWDTLEARKIKATKALIDSMVLKAQQAIRESLEPSGVEVVFAWHAGSSF